MFTFATLGKMALVLAMVVALTWGVFALHGAYKTYQCDASHLSVSYTGLTGDVTDRYLRASQFSAAQGVCLHQWP